MKSMTHHLSSLLLLGALLLGSPAAADTSDPGATSCIRVRGGAGYGIGQTDQNFWGYFQNVCGSNVNKVVFDVLLFWCDNQSPPGSSCATVLRVDAELTRSFAPYQTRKIEYVIPAGIQTKLACGYYQWDINLKVNGCTDHGDCWNKAKGLPATWGSIYKNGLNCGKECLLGDTKPCASGCGTTSCAPDGGWDSSTCTAKNTCGDCSAVNPPCCTGETAICSTGCGSRVCKNDQWDDTACVQQNACGQCPGTAGSDTCCPGEAPACGPCSSPVCTATGWTCAPAQQPTCTGCKGPVCVAGGWVCQYAPPPQMSDCKNAVCLESTWTCLPESGGDPPPAALEPANDQAIEVVTVGGCSLAPVCTALPLGGLTLLTLLGLALGRRRP